VPQTLTSKKRVFIVDDHPVIRHGVTQTLSTTPDLEPVGEAGSSSEAIGRLRSCSADLVLVDISLAGTNGIELTKQIRAEHPKLPILILSMHEETLYANRALKAGANGYLMKRAGADELLKAVRSLLAGTAYRSPQNGGTSDSALEELTDRELEILQLVGEGQSTREIAARLNLSSKTIETHRLNLKEKLHLKTAPELVRYAVDWVRTQHG
jgi:DNA-binding NarL/FixJ family response regulator